MKRFVLLGLLMIALTQLAMSQVGPRVVDTLYAYTESDEDPKVRLRFGIDPGYTDSLDNEGPEFEIPAIPPAFYGWFNYPAQPSNVLYLLNADIRGIPDSVADGTSRRFSLDYYLRLSRGAAVGHTLTVGFIRHLTTYIDSVNITDVITGQVVNHTFQEQGGLFDITNDGIDALHMRVYFNLDIAGVLADAAERSIDRNLPIVPNPARSGEPVFVTEKLPAGARIVVTDMLGNSTELARTSEEQSNLHLDLPDLGSGMYMVRVVGATGEILRSGRLLLVN
jgi:hypothetical protein